MKKVLLIFLIFLCTNAVWADFMPAYTNSVKFWGIGTARITNDIRIYTEASESSKPLQRIYWNNIGNFLCGNEKFSCRAEDIFVGFKPKSNMAFFSVKDETEDWIQVCFDQKKQSFGWIKKESGAKFFPWGDFLFEYGKKYGMYVFRNIPTNIRGLHARADADSEVIDNFDLAKFITPWLIRGNWALVKVVTYDGNTKTGWMKWRDENGMLYGFVNLDD